MSRLPSRTWPLLPVLALVLFPMGWLGQVNPTIGQWLGRLFSTDQAHAAGHTLMFAGLGLILCALFPALRTRPLLFAACILAVALGQEAFQLLYKGRPLLADDFTDLLVDMTAAGAAYALARGWGSARRPAPVAPLRRTR